mgnify:CR=1 FL=1
MKKLLALLLALVMVFALAACGGTEGTPSDAPASDAPASEAPADSGDGTVANKDKPLVWFNRQPSNSTTGELDMAALTFNDNTYYVGFDANQGAELQGTMILDYIKANIEGLDRNATASSATSWPSATSATTTPSPVPAACAARSAPPSRLTASSTAPPSAPTLTAPPPTSRTASSRSTAPPTSSVSWPLRR